jgi:hypothetical protein
VIARRRAPVNWDDVLLFLPIFEQPGYIAGRWEEPEGQFPYYVYRPEIMRFLETMDSASITLQFDWPSWQRRAERYYREPSTLDTARLTTLRRLLTLHIRKDRFCEGHLAVILESGHIAAILRRISRLVVNQSA